MEESISELLSNKLIQHMEKIQYISETLNHNKLFLLTWKKFFEDNPTFNAKMEEYNENTREIIKIMNSTLESLNELWRLTNIVHDYKKIGEMWSEYSTLVNNELNDIYNKKRNLDKLFNEAVIMFDKEAGLPKIPIIPNIYISEKSDKNIDNE